MLKKVVAILLCFCLSLGAFTVFASADNGYGSNYDVVDDNNLGEDIVYHLTSKKLRITENFISGFYAGMPVLRAAEMFDDPQYISFMRDGKYLTLDDTVKTGDFAVSRENSEDSLMLPIVVLGDANADGKANVTDIITVADAILSGKQQSELFCAATDFNDDGILSVTDIIRLRKQIIKGTDKALMNIDYSEKSLKYKDCSDYLKMQGRVYKYDDYVGMDLTGCGLEFNAQCEGNVTISISGGSGQIIRATVDGIESQQITINGDPANVTIAENLTRGTHNFKIYKVTSCNPMRFTGLSLSGELGARVPDSKKHIEIIGDSISCGSGNVIEITLDDGSVFKDYDGVIETVKLKFQKSGEESVSHDIDYCGSDNSSVWVSYPDGGYYKYLYADYTITEDFYDKSGKLLYSVPYNENRVHYSGEGTRSYSILTAQNLGYDWSIFSQDGQTMEQMYSRYLGRYPSATSQPYAPEYSADVVVVNLSTNGISSTASEKYLNSMSNFYALLRKTHPNAKIIFCYGAMTQHTFAGLHQGIRDHVENLGGSKAGIYSFGFTLSRDGAGGHPSVANDRIMASELADFIRSIS